MTVEAPFPNRTDSPRENLSGRYDNTIIQHFVMPQSGRHFEVAFNNEDFVADFLRTAGFTESLTDDGRHRVFFFDTPALQWQSSAFESRWATHNTGPLSQEALAMRVDSARHGMGMIVMWPYEERDMERHDPFVDEADIEDAEDHIHDRPIGKVRHPLVAWTLASLRIMWSCIRHPNKPIWIDYNTGDVWLKRD